jgi:hypothetical protein
MKVLAGFALLPDLALKGSPAFCRYFLNVSCRHEPIDQITP